MHSHSRRILVVVFSLLLFGIAAWWALRNNLSGFDVKAHYTKLEYQIPMRDGVKLFTAVYVPKDTSQPYPFLVNRTPFGVLPVGRDRYPARLGPAEAFDRSGYIFVFQDVRGRNQSEGQFVDMRPHIDHPNPAETDEATDMYDTIEWLLKHVPGNNGKVGIWGLSYPGFYTSASIIDSHPAIKAASPEAPVTNLFEGDDAYHNGAFMLAAQFQFYSTFFKPRPNGPEPPPARFIPFDFGTNDGYRYFLLHGPELATIAASIKNPFFDENIKHNTDDDYWESRDISRHLNGVSCAVLNVAGWFDAEDLAGPFRTYHAIEKNNPSIFNVLVVGPWEHGAWLRLYAGSPKRIELEAAQYFREHIVFPFFEHFLKTKGDPHLPQAAVFETGSNAWRQYDAWPPKNREPRSLYLHSNGKLSFDPPAASEPAYDEYISDPRDPVPYIPYAATDLAEEFMFGDQRFAAKRRDVLTYVSDSLEDDVTVVGPVAPYLQVSTSGTDSDFDVKLIDVFPGDSASNSTPSQTEAANSDLPVASERTSAYQQLVRGEPMRARFRNSWSNPQPMTPNQVTSVSFEMPDVNHTFRHGHRIMVHIQSSWFPLTDLNPQTFVNPALANSSDFVKATQRVYHTPQAASRIALAVVPRH